MTTTASDLHPGRRLARAALLAGAVGSFVGYLAACGALDWIWP